MDDTSNLDVLHSALIKADAAGDTAGAKVLAEQIRSLQGSQTSNVVTLPPTQYKNAGPLGNLIYGAAKGAADMVQAPAQMALNSVNSGMQSAFPDSGATNYIGDKTKQFNDYLTNQENQYQLETPGSIAAGAGRVLANVAPFMASDGATAVPQLSRAAQLGKAIATGAGSTALMQPINGVQTQDNGQNDFMSQKLLQAGLGAAGGLVGGGIGSIANSLINPAISQDAQAALKLGITPTIGQILGGTPAAMENKLTSVPILGDIIKNAQRGTTEDFNRAAYNTALNPIGKTTNDLGNVALGNQSVNAVKNELSKAYDNTLSRMNFKGDQQFGSDLNSLVGMVSNGNVPPTIANQFRSIIQNNVLSRMTPQGAMDGQQYKLVESDLINKAKTFSASSDPNQRQLGAALGQTVRLLKSALSRSNPEEAANLAKINDAWANYARIRGAASGTGTVEGVFTPSQLAQAVRSQDRSVGKGDFATGQARMQDLANVGKNIAPTYPDSGTTGRATELAMLAALVTAPKVAIPATIAGGIAALPYTMAGKRIAAKLLTQRPPSAPAIGQGVQQALPVGFGVGVPLLGQYFNGGN